MSAPFPRHPNTVILPPAIHVSPLIRFSRYTALVLGMLWGAWRLRRISEYHADMREWEHEKKVAKAEYDEKLKRWFNKEETISLMGYLGIPVDEGAVQFGTDHLFRED